MESNEHKKFADFEDTAADDTSDFYIDLEELFAKRIEREEDDTEGDGE